MTITFPSKKRLDNEIIIILYTMILIMSGCVTLSHNFEDVVKEAGKEEIQLDLPSYFGPKKVITVLDLNNKSEFKDPKLEKGITEMLISALVESGRFRVVERKTEIIESILIEQKFSTSGLVDLKTAAKIGKILGAQAVVVGEITEFGIRKTGVYTGFSGTRNITTRVAVDVRMVDVETTEIIISKSGTGQCTKQSVGSGMVLTFEYGTEGFDETSIGIATRKAVYDVVRKIAISVE